MRRFVKWAVIVIVCVVAINALLSLERPDDIGPKPKKVELFAYPIGFLDDHTAVLRSSENGMRGRGILTLDLNTGAVTPAPAPQYTAIDLKPAKATYTFDVPSEDCVEKDGTVFEKTAVSPAINVKKYDKNQEDVLVQYDIRTGKASIYTGAILKNKTMPEFMPFGTAGFERTATKNCLAPIDPAYRTKSVCADKSLPFTCDEPQYYADINLDEEKLHDLPLYSDTSTPKEAKFCYAQKCVTRTVPPMDNLGFDYSGDAKRSYSRNCIGFKGMHSIGGGPIMAAGTADKIYGIQDSCSTSYARKGIFELVANQWVKRFAFREPEGNTYMISNGCNFVWLYQDKGTVEWVNLCQP